MRLAAVALWLALLAGVSSAAELEVGAPAPPFTLYGSDGGVRTLEQFRGTRGLVLAWFPKAFTPG